MAATIQETYKTMLTGPYDRILYELINGHAGHIEVARSSVSCRTESSLMVSYVSFDKRPLTICHPHVNIVKFSFVFITRFKKM